MEFNILYTLLELRNPILNGIMIFLSSIGDAGLIWIGLTIVFLIFKKTRQMGVAMAFSLIIMQLVGNVAIKHMVQRERPCWIDTSVPMLIPVPKDFSFPSGHTYSSFSAATAIYLHQKKWGVAAFILAGLIAFSRLYLFVHFPTDILGGIILGLITGYFGTKLAAHSKLKERFY